MDAQKGSNSKMSKVKSIDNELDYQSSDLSQMIDDFLDHNSEKNDELVNVKMEIFLA